MSFVKWGIDSYPVKTTFTVDGIPLKQYRDMLLERKAMLGMMRKLIACCDEERDGAIIQEARSLLARMGACDD
jgi:hypothetical protein